MSSTDRDYYTARAETARRQAESAADQQIANIHHEMAERYDQRARSAPDEDAPLAA